MADDLSDKFDLGQHLKPRKRKLVETEKKSKKSRVMFEKKLKIKKKSKKEDNENQKEEKDEHVMRALTASSLTSAIARQYKSVLSPLEFQKISLEDGHFSLCNDQTHTLVSLIRTIMPRVNKCLSSNDGVVGRPVLLVVCSSGIRCVQLIKQLSEFKSDKCTIAKLFAKHLKLDMTQKFLKSKPIHMAVGTPHRISLLLRHRDITLQSTQHMILDWSHRDAKKMNMLQIKVVREDLMELLATQVIPHVRSSNNNNNNENNDNGNNNNNNNNKKNGDNNSNNKKNGDNNNNNKKNGDNNSNNNNGKSGSKILPCKIALF